jgi:hypothetical protein
VATVHSVGLRWQSLILSPQRQAWMSPPEVPDDPRFRWWLKLREVPSAWIAREGETERFLYYDGPTTARSPLVATLEGDNLALSPCDVFNESGRTSRDYFPDKQKSCLLVDSREMPVQGCAFRPVSVLGGRHVMALKDQTWFSGDDVERALLEMLLQQGLNGAEAAGLLDSWRERFFQSPGQRLLTLLTRSEYDRMCPLKVRPEPTEIVRVGIVLREF